MPLFGKKRKKLEQQAAGSCMAESELRAWRDEAQRLRKYINSEMSRHFESYNGGMVRQMQAMLEMRLPTPWVPAGIKNIEDPVPDYVPYNTITYVRESRMVPITQAGRI